MIPILTVAVSVELRRGDQLVEQSVDCCQCNCRRVVLKHGKIVHKLLNIILLYRESVICAAQSSHRVAHALLYRLDANIITYEKR